MPQTEAQKKAKLKYDAKTYKIITCKCKIPDYEKFKKYADKQNISSMNRLLYTSVNYCINNNIDLSSSSDQDTNNNTADI